MARTLVIGNWKMNGSLASNRKLVLGMLEERTINRSGVALACPTVYLLQLADLLQLSPIALAAQDVSQFSDDGAFSGEVSAFMLANVGCRYVLVGHSERRQYLAEGESVLALKLANVIKAGLTPVLCVGETLKEREAGRHLEVIGQQFAITASLPLEHLVIAYEPIWAIGTGHVASLDQIKEIHHSIKEASLPRLGGFATIPVLYGGSVKADNAAAILSIDGVDGALVGGASLDVASFSMICQAANNG